MKLHPAANRSFWQRLSQVALLLVLGALGGAFNLVGTSFAVLAARAASLPEEEEHKDKGDHRIAQLHAKRGGQRPISTRRIPLDQRSTRNHLSTSTPFTEPVGHTSLMGAGIFMHC